MSSSSLDSQRHAPRTHSPRRSGFIDRGAPVPDFYPGTRLRTAVRGPDTLFVDWESEDDAASGDGWHVAAYDADENQLAEFETPPGRHRSGYLVFADTSRAVTVVLSLRRDGRRLETMRVAVRTLPSASGDGEEHWVDIRTHEDAAPPSPGRVRLAPGQLGTASSPTPSSGDVRR